MICEDVRTALGALEGCLDTDEGARIATHCLYPSFEPVHVFVAKVGDGFKVHDGGGAFRCAWTHGRDDVLIRRMLSYESARHSLKVSNSSLIASVESQDWLLSAILSVANASASAASAAVNHAAAGSEKELMDRVYTVLSECAGTVSTVTREYAVHGKSGKLHRFDFGVSKEGRSILLVNIVSPHPISVFVNYVSFADANEESAKFAVHDRRLTAEDSALLQQVADIVPLTSLEGGARRVLHDRQAAR